MKFVIPLFFAFLLLSSAASAGLGGNKQAAECAAAEQTIQLQSGKTYVISKSDKEGFEKKILELMYVAIDDTARGSRGNHKVDMLARKQYFTEKGWGEYQTYVSKMKDSFQLSEYKGMKSVYGSLFPGTQNYERWYGDNLGFAAIGYLGYADADVVNYDAAVVEFNIAFTPQEPAKPESILIDTWRIHAFASSPGLSNWP